MSDSLQLHGLQHSRLPCPAPSSGVCPSSCPLNWWCHPTSFRVFPNESVVCIRWLSPVIRHRLPWEEVHHWGSTTDTTTTGGLSAATSTHLPPLLAIYFTLTLSLCCHPLASWWLTWWYDSDSQLLKSLRPWSPYCSHAILHWSTYYQNWTRHTKKCSNGSPGWKAYYYYYYYFASSV